MTPAPPTDAELADAVARFHALVDPAAVHARPNLPPGAVPPHRRIADGPLSANTGGYSVARSRRDAEVPEWVADTVAETLIAAPPTADSLPAGRVGKGTTVGPVARLAGAHEMASGCVLRPEVGAMYGPHRVSEQALALRLLDRLPARAMVVADRNFGIFGFVHAADTRGIGVIARLTQGRFRQAGPRRHGEGAGCGGGCAGRRAGTTAASFPELPDDTEVWADVYEVTVAGGTVRRLVRTVSVGAATAAAIYKRRGDGETDIRDAKCTLDMRELRGKSADVIRKELAAGVVAHNLVAQVRRLAAAAGVAPRRLGFAGVRSLVGAMLWDHPPGTAAEWVGWFDRACE